MSNTTSKPPSAILPSKIKKPIVIPFGERARLKIMPAKTASPAAVKAAKKKRLAQDMATPEGLILLARESLMGYEYRLSDADRALKIPPIAADGRQIFDPKQRELDHLKMLNFATSNQWEHSEIDPLLERIKTHPNPPYSADTLLTEYKNLQDIPPRNRLEQSYIPRMWAWLDRVEAFLTLPTPKGNAPDGGSAIDDGLDQKDREILRQLKIAAAGMTLDLLASRAKMSAKICGERIRDKLLPPGYVGRRGEKGNVWITAKGKARLATMT